MTEVIKIEELVKYVRIQIYILDKMPIDSFLKNHKIEWIDFSKL